MKNSGELASPGEKKYLAKSQVSSLHLTENRYRNLLRLSSTRETRRPTSLPTPQPLPPHLQPQQIGRHIPFAFAFVCGHLGAGHANQPAHCGGRVRHEAIDQVTREVHPDSCRFGGDIDKILRQCEGWVVGGMRWGLLIQPLGQH